MALRTAEVSTHVCLLVLSALLASLSLDISMDRTFEAAESKAAFDRAIADTVVYYTGTQRFAAFFGTAAGVSLLFAVASSSFMQLFERTRMKPLAWFMFGFMVCSLSYAHFITVGRFVNQALESGETRQLQAAANFRYVELGLIICAITMLFAGGGVPARPEVPLLGLALGYNAKDLLFDLPALFQPGDASVVHQSVINNTAHLQGHIHELVVPLIIVSLGIVLGLRFKWGEFGHPGPVPRGNLLLLALLVLGGPGFLLLVEPCEYALQRRVWDSGTTKITSPDVLELLRVIAAGHLYLAGSCVVGLVIQFIAIHESQPKEDLRPILVRSGVRPQEGNIRPGNGPVRNE